MASTRRVVSAEHLAKMQAGAKAARAAKIRAGQKCGACGRKVQPVNGEYVRSSTRRGVVYCWPTGGCWTDPKRKRRKVADL